MKQSFATEMLYTALAIILMLAFGLVGCGGNNLVQSAEPTEEVLPTEEPTEEVIPTEEPTEEVIPTEEPTEEVVPTVIPTESVFYLPPITGKYSVSGLDPDFNNYEGELEITASNGFFLWNWPDRERDGVGVDQENVVSVAWLEGLGSCNAMSFVIQEDGVLEGFYTSEVGGTQFGTTIARPAGEMGDGIEGTYDFIGSLQTTAGSASGPLEITRDGDVYDFYWEFYWGEWYGVGIQRGNIVSVGYAHRKSVDCMVVSYLMEEDGTLDGIWAYLGDAEFGTDVAVPETSE